MLKKRYHEHSGKYILLLAEMRSVTLTDINVP